jgi:hypothetical protein
MVVLVVVVAVVQVPAMLAAQELLVKATTAVED